MKNYTITVIQTAEVLSDVDDKWEKPEGTYFVTARGKEEALGHFHAAIPIGCLEDFEISIKEDNDSA